MLMRSVGLACTTLVLGINFGLIQNIAQANSALSTQQLAANWVSCRQGRLKDEKTCTAIETEFNRRSTAVLERDVRIQRGEAIAEKKPSTTPVTRSGSRPQAAPARTSRPTTQPAARPQPKPAARPSPAGATIVKDDPGCEGRQVVPVPGGYACF